MKSQRILATLAIGSLSLAGLSNAAAQQGGKPVVITPPAVQDGSNWSRAPFPAQRRYDDLKSPDGQAIDQNSPGNSEATNIEPPVPPARVAILQPTAPAGVAVATATTPEPVLAPTGRVAVATTLDAATFGPSIRAATHANKNQIIADIESRLNATDAAIGNARSALSSSGRQAFATAEDTVKQKAKALRKSLDNARKASAAEWENARMQLAADFDAYAAAIANIDATATGR